MQMTLTQDWIAINAALVFFTATLESKTKILTTSLENFDLICLMECWNPMTSDRFTLHVFSRFFTLKM